MDSNVNVEGTYSELAISAINLNVESEVQYQSSLSYYRLFHLGKPVSEFCCKTCKTGLGHTAPSKCDRCRPYTKSLQSLERTVVGFTQIQNGIVMGEYLLSLSVR